MYGEGLRLFNFKNPQTAQVQGEIYQADAVHQPHPVELLIEITVSSPVFSNVSSKIVVICQLDNMYDL